MDRIYQRKEECDLFHLFFKKTHISEKKNNILPICLYFLTVKTLFIYVYIDCDDVCFCNGGNRKIVFFVVFFVLIYIYIYLCRQPCCFCLF